MDSRRPLALLDTPPVWLAAGIALVWAQSRWLPLWPVTAGLRTAGFVVIALAVVLFLLAAREFRRHRTTIIPRETPTALLASGPYALSRNPIYLADAMLLSGVVLIRDLGAAWAVAAFVLVIQGRFIRGEEAGCAQAFGAAWQAYAARVRRWL
jgi:protein-S-isoprenylcysteine O-methyltransferase Ste14